MNIYIFLTFDHELPLGGLQTSYEKALFDPTDRVMELANKFGIKITLFTDILCANRYKEWDYANFYDPYILQLHHAIGSGHDVQLHIHPHWLTSTYDGTTFVPSNHFALSDFKNDTQHGGIPGIIALSINQLNGICSPVSEKYKCIAFRAGGYTFFPDTEALFSCLYDHGIRYDSSMAKGYYFKSGLTEVDFRKLPNSPNWIIDHNNYHRPLSNTLGITEIPIATIPKTLFEMPTRFKLKKYAHRAVENRGKMIHAHAAPSLHLKIHSKMKMLLSARMLSFDNHTLSLDYLLRIVRYNINRYKKYNEVMFSLISHPKSMGDYSFELMEGFIESIQKSFPDVEFSTFSEYHQTHN